MTRNHCRFFATLPNDLSVTITQFTLPPGLRYSNFHALIQFYFQLPITQGCAVLTKLFPKVLRKVMIGGATRDA